MWHEPDTKKQRQAQQDYEVEAVVDKREKGAGVTEFRVRWKGYGNPSEDTWEPLQALQAVKAKVAEFEKTERSKSAKQKAAEKKTPAQRKPAAQKKPAAKPGNKSKKESSAKRGRGRPAKAKPEAQGGDDEEEEEVKDEDGDEDEGTFCTNCGESGHEAKDCGKPQKKGRPFGHKPTGKVAKKPKNPKKSSGAAGGASAATAGEPKESRQEVRERKANEQLRETEHSLPGENIARLSHVEMQALCARTGAKIVGRGSVRKKKAMCAHLRSFVTSNLPCKVIGITGTLGAGKGTIVVRTQAIKQCNPHHTPRLDGLTVRDMDLPDRLLVFPSRSIWLQITGIVTSQCVLC